MSRIFLSHSKEDMATAVALCDWLTKEGWDDIFLDLDPDRGIAPGARWEQALHAAARRCEIVLFLISRTWLSSVWCQRELNLAQRLNKRMLGLLIEDIPFSDVPIDLSGTWQLLRLVSGRDHVLLRAVLPVTHEEQHVTFSAEGLQRLKRGLDQAGLDPRFFPWPPAHDPNRPPYRGLRPLEADDAGIFFGREAPVVDAIDRLRGMTAAAPPRIVAILGASGAGKSSFLRAGLLPRLARDAKSFLPLPVVRPERSALTGETGLVASLVAACAQAGLKVSRGDIREAVLGGSASLKVLLRRILDAQQPPSMDDQPPGRGPTLIIPIDQGEELFLAEAQAEAQPFLELLSDLLKSDEPAVLVLFSIRSDTYERLQQAEQFNGMHQEAINLGPIPKGSYVDVIKGPVNRLEGTPRAVRIEEALVDALLVDIEVGGAKDALPLLAFTLERLYDEYGATGTLALDHFNRLGRVKGSIEAAVTRALSAADADSRVPRDREARLALLRRGLIPWLAGIDPDTKAPRRRVARLSELPAETRPLIDLLVDQRLLSVDIAQDTGETTIEPSHEALLRQWGLLQSWLVEDTALLTVLDGIKRASRDWVSHGRSAAWLAHGGDRLRAARSLSARPDLAANIEPAELDYLNACVSQENTVRARARRGKLLVGTLVLLILGSLAGLFQKEQIAEHLRWYSVALPYKHANFDPYALSRDAEQSLTGESRFRECLKHCPEMTVVAAGTFSMGSPPDEPERFESEGPQRTVAISKSFAVSRFPVTFEDWNACVSVAACLPANDGGFGEADRPVINVSWSDAQTYVAWLSQMTGKHYRLLTEAEWEYAARAGTSTRYYWGVDVGENNAVCDGCGSEWDSLSTAPVGKFSPNKFGLHDMVGNVFQWVQDCFHENYVGAPGDGTAWVEHGDCSKRQLRGGAWPDVASFIRSASRFGLASDMRSNVLGFRVARNLDR